MSPKRWILLLIFYISYLMFGASIYYHIEHGLEKQRRAEELRDRIEIHEYLLDQLIDKNLTTKEEILQKISNYCKRPVTDYKTDEFELPYTWTFYHSFFFAFTVCSTVGYGNISPSSTLGRMIMIAYSVIGIPINGILFAGLGEYFGKTFHAIYHRYKKYKMTNDVRYMPPQLSLVTTVLIALIPGVTLFIFLPSWVFSYFEDWPYSLAVYYSYVTTTTIGFGDYVPSFQSHQPYKFGGWFIVYEIFIIVWFIFSLGYLVMIMTFITRGLQSKKLAHLEQQLSSNIKSTQSRIWHGVTKDVGYLRRILNELYIMKFKPVYTKTDSSYILHRSNSCPDMTMYRTESPVITRKRAFSESFDTLANRESSVLLKLHTASDSDLDKFDRQKSFESAEAFRQTTGLLAKVVSALANVKPPEEDDQLCAAYHGLSDSEILASEWASPNIVSRSHTLTQPQYHRGRACSDFNINPKWNIIRPRQNEWTWSGDNNQIQQAINNRVMHANPRADHDITDHLSNSFDHSPLDYVVHMDNEDLRKARPKKFSLPDGLRKLFPFRKRSSQSESMVAGMTVPVTQRKFSVISAPESPQYGKPQLNYYSTVTASASPTYFRQGHTRRSPNLPTIQQSPPSTTASDNVDHVNNDRYTSASSLSSRLSAAAAPNSSIPYDRLFDAEQIFQSNASLAYQRYSAAAATRKRRESLFTQNPTNSSSRSSMYPPPSGQRRSSLFNTERRDKILLNEQRPSLFSVTSAESCEVLETTTLADLIRALEVIHTQAVLDEATNTMLAFKSNQNITNDREDYYSSGSVKKKQKISGFALSELPPLLSLFTSDNNKLLATAAANRFYARRSTVVGTISPPATAIQTNEQQPLNSPTANILTRRRLSSLHKTEPPPSREEKKVLAATPATATKFNRRFSVRPTALQIPPGKAPPSGINTNTMSLPSQPSCAGIAAPIQNVTSMSQTILQRRLSQRPSPLARDTTTALALSNADDGTAAAAAAAIASAAVSITARSTTATSSGRLLPSCNTRPSSSSITSSTYSPLSRIVQIAQAQRKSSMTDSSVQERLRKPDGENESEVDQMKSKK